MRLGPLVLAWPTEPTRMEAMRALLPPEPPMTALESENAQAEREIASLAHDDDPQPGAFYGHDTEPDTEAEPTHA